MDFIGKLKTDRNFLIKTIAIVFGVIFLPYITIPLLIIFWAYRYITNNNDKFKHLSRPITLQWFVVVLSLLFTLVGLSESFLSFIAGALFSFLISPVSDKIISEKFHKSITFGNKATMLVVLFFAFFLSFPKNDTVASTVANVQPVKENVQKDLSISQTSPTLSQTQPAISPSQMIFDYSVLRVVDGDTIVVTKDNKEEKVRLIGVDTPETVDPRKDVQCFGKESSDYLTKLLTNKKIAMEADTTQDNLDKYGRSLRYIYLEDKTLVNKAIIEQGYGFEYTYNVPYKYQTEFKDAQKYAETNKLGLWADNMCNIVTNTTHPSTLSTSPVTSDNTTVTTSNVTTPTKAPTTTTSSGGVVKKSTTGICHAPGTTYYNKTTNFTAFDSVQACLDSGGRLPKR